MDVIGTPVGVAEARRLLGHRKARPASVGKDSALRRLLAAGDAAAVLLALMIALLAPRTSAPTHRLLWGLVAVPLMMVLFKLYGLYDRDVKRISYSTVDDLPWLFHATVIGGLILWLYARYSPMHRLDFTEILLFGITVIALVTAARFAVRSIAGRLIGVEHALLVGTGDMGQILVGKLAAHPEYRLNVIGSLSPGDEAPPEHDNRRVPALGTLEQLEQVADLHDVTRVVFSARDIEESELERMLRDCRSLSLKVSVLPRLADVLGPAVELDDVEGVTVLGVNPALAAPLLTGDQARHGSDDRHVSVDSRGAAAWPPGGCDQARLAGSRVVRTAASWQARAPLPSLQVAHDVRRRRAAARATHRPEHGIRLAEARPRPAGHPHRPVAAALELGRAAAAVECRARRDEPGRAASIDPGRGSSTSRPGRADAWISRPESRATGRCSDGLGSRSRRW